MDFNVTSTAYRDTPQDERQTDRQTETLRDRETHTHTLRDRETETETEIRIRRERKWTFNVYYHLNIYGYYMTVIYILYILSALIIIVILTQRPLAFVSFDFVCRSHSTSRLKGEGSQVCMYIIYRYISCLIQSS